MYYANECSCNGVNFKRNYFGGNNKFACKDHSKCLTVERVQANHFPEGPIGLIEGLKKKVTQLQNKKKPAVQLNKKKEKDYYCLMLRKINGLDKKIQNLQSLFVNYLDRDSENSIYANELSSRKLDYTDIYAAVRSLTNLINQLKEELLHTENQTTNCKNEDSSRHNEKIKFLETELRNLYQYWDYYQNISDSKEISENKKASLKEGTKFNNTCNFPKMGVSENERATSKEHKKCNNTRNFPKIEENSKVRRSTDWAARNDPKNKNITCNCKTELCNVADGKDCFNCKRENHMFEDCKNVYCDRQCPSCNSSSDRSCSNESLCSGNGCYHYKSREKPFCHKCDGREAREQEYGIRQEYNANKNQNKCNRKNCCKRCGICGSTAIDSNLYPSNKAPKSKKNTGVNDQHKLMYDSEESVPNAQPRANYYKDNNFRRRNIDVRDIKKIKEETGSSRDEIVFKKNNNKKVAYALKEHYPKNQGRHLECREIDISSDSSNGESYYNDRSYRSPRGRINEANHRRASYCDCTECNDEKKYHPSRQRIFNKKSDVSLQQNNNSTCYRGCKECNQNNLNNNLPKDRYNVSTAKEKVIESRRYGRNKKNNQRYLNNKERQSKQRYRHYHKNSGKNFNDTDNFNGLESEEVLTTTSFEKGHRANHNVARDHIHVSFHSGQHINRGEKNKNHQKDVIEERSLIETKKSKENTRPEYRDKNSSNKKRNKDVGHFQGKRGSSEDSLTSLKSAGSANPPFESKVYFCKDSECDNVRNKEGIIVWLNSEQNNITESVFNKIVEIVRDFNTNMCDKCIIKSQRLKVDPKNYKYANKKTKILLNKEVIRCDDCRKSLEDQISNLLDGRQMNYVINQNREHSLRGDNLIVRKKVSLSHNTKLDSVNSRQYKPPLGHNIDQEIVPVFQMEAKENDPFKKYGSIENENNELVKIPNNANGSNTIANAQFPQITSNSKDNLKNNHVQKKCNAEMMKKSTENNYMEGENRKETTNNFASQENSEQMKQKSKPNKEQNNAEHENHSQMFAETNVRTKLNTEKPLPPNHNDYQLRTSVKSPLYSELNSDINIRETHNSVKQGGQNKNQKRKTKKSKTSLNSEHSSRSNIETEVDPRIKQPIIEKVQIKTSIKEHPNKPNKQVFEKNEYTSRKWKERNQPSQKFSDDCKFILPVKNDFKNSSSMLTSSQENLRNSACYSNRNIRKDFEYNGRSKARNASKNGAHRYAILYPELCDEFQRNNAFHGNRGKYNNYCKNNGGSADMDRYRFKSFTITSDSSFSFMDWGNIANKLKTK